jgi:hypothetical protein
MSVVVLIGLVLLFALLPVAVGLLRQQAGIGAHNLGVDTWPLLVERITLDAGRSSGAFVSPPFPSPAFRLHFPAVREEDPDVTWTFAPGSVERAVAFRKPEGPPARSAVRWDVPGLVALDPDELENGRLLLAFDDGSGRELFALACGRPTERAR